MTIKVSPAFILTLAPLSTSELRPSETNWASVNNYRDLAAPTETARPWLVWRDRAAMGRSDPAVSLKTSASFTGGCWKKFSLLAEQAQKWGHGLLHLKRVHLGSQHFFKH